MSNLDTNKLERIIIALGGNILELKTNFIIERLEKIVELLSGPKVYLTNLETERLNDIIVSLGGTSKPNATIQDLIDSFNAIIKEIEVSGEYITVNDSLNMPCNISIDTNIKQDTITDNLFDNEWEQGNVAGSTGATENSIDFIRTKNYQKVIPNVLYKLSRNISTSYMYFRFYDKDLNFLGTQSTSHNLVTTNQADNRMNVGISEMEFTVINTNVAYMKCCDNSNDLTTIYTLTTEQTPSIEFPSEIKTPVGKQSFYVGDKNLLPNNLVTQDVNGTLLTINEDKSFTIKGTTIGSLSSKSLEIGRIPLKAILDIPVTLSRGFINKDNNIGAFVSKIKDSNGNTILNNAMNLDTNSWVQHVTKTFTSAEWGSYDDLELVVILFFPSLDNVTINLAGYAQLEYGDTATDYIEHQSQVQDLDVGELLGTIVDKEDGSYFENRYGRYIFTGNEYCSNQYGTNLFDYQGLLNKKPFKANVKAYCNYFKYNFIQSGINANTVNGDFALQLSDYDYNVFFKCTDYDNVDDFKAKLKELYDSGNPIEILYPLENPTYAKLTDEQQAQWNKIKKMHTYEGVTNIYTINDNGISPVINLKYKTKEV